MYYKSHPYYNNLTEKEKEEIKVIAKEYTSILGVSGDYYLNLILNALSKDLSETVDKILNGEGSISPKGIMNCTKNKG